MSMLIKYTRLGTSAVNTAFCAPEDNVGTFRKILASQIGGQIDISQIDVIVRGKIAEESREISTIDQPIQFVVHNADRFVPVSQRTSEYDMINGEWDTDPRFLMSCGHAINPDNLYGYCWGELEKDKCQMRCPKVSNGEPCSLEWFFPEIVEKACLSDDERILFEIRLNENFNTAKSDIRECPFCGELCERRNPDDPIVICSYCKLNGKTVFKFCWFCLIQVNNSSHECGKESIRNILQDCSRKTIIELPGVPSVRACPKCKSLIEHREGCKQMECRCGQKFCFICLKMAENGNYRCGSYNYKCELAPVQKI